MVVSPAEPGSVLIMWTTWKPVSESESHCNDNGSPVNTNSGMPCAIVSLARTLHCRPFGGGMHPLYRGWHNLRYRRWFFL